MSYLQLDEMLPGYISPPWEFLRPLARKLGFAAIGIAPAGVVAEGAAKRYHRWLANGYFADMAYMTRYKEQRLDIRHPGILADAEAVIVAALPYGNGAIRGGLWDYVASHARAMDYHQTVKERLKTMVETIETHFPKSRCRVFVDTAPVMERYWALKSGIGSLGKNGAVIVPQVGSHVVLGEIVCSSVSPPLSISPREPFELCRDCERCMTACPTGAIKAPAAIDSNLCLSYWTIEHKDGAIPPGLARKITLVFGCDQCTTQCPHEPLDYPSSLKPPPARYSADITLETIIQMDDRTIEKMIAGTPLARTGPHRIRQNAMLVLQNQRKIE